MALNRTTRLRYTVGTIYFWSEFIKLLVIWEFPEKIDSYVCGKRALGNTYTLSHSTNLDVLLRVLVG